MPWSLAPLRFTSVLRLSRLLLAALLMLLFAHREVHAQAALAVSDGVVRITSVADGVRKTGTGFIVQTSDDAIYIATASHVVEGDKTPKIAFHAEPNSDVDGQVLKLEGGDPKGLALVVVRNNVRRLLRQVQVLQLAPSNELTAGDQVMAIGFPQGGGPWAMVPTSIASREGRDLVVAGNLNEGNSGGPLLKDGIVVGLVTGMQGQYGRATPAPIVRIAMEGWGVRLGATSRAAGNVQPPGNTSGPAQAGASPQASGKTFRVSVENGRVDPGNYSGNCPVKLNFTWTIKGSDGPGRVTYNFVRSDTVKSPVQTIDFKGVGGRSINYVWSLGRADVARTFDGWVSIEITEPHSMQSEHVDFHVECAGKGAEEDSAEPGVPNKPADAPNKQTPAAISVTGTYAGQLQGMTAMGQTYSCGFAAVMAQVGADVNGQYQNTCGDQGIFAGQLTNGKLAGGTVSQTSGGYCPMLIEVTQDGAALAGQYECMNGERGTFSMKRQ